MRVTIEKLYEAERYDLYQKVFCCTENVTILSTSSGNMTTKSSRNGIETKIPLVLH